MEDSLIKLRLGSYFKSYLKSSLLFTNKMALCNRSLLKGWIGNLNVCSEEFFSSKLESSLYKKT